MQRCELNINFQNIFPPAQTWSPPIKDSLWRRVCRNCVCKWT